MPGLRLAASEAAATMTPESRALMAAYSMRPSHEAERP
jgi:hypothetical protein